MSGLGDGFAAIARAQHSLDASLAEIAAKARKEKDVLLEAAKLAKQNKATEFYDRLLYWIDDFDRSLDDEHEVGIHLVSFGKSVTFHVEKLGCHDPSLIVFHGRTDDGDPVTLVQHVSQISLLLTSVERADPSTPKKPLGFAMPRSEHPAEEGEV